MSLRVAGVLVAVSVARSYSLEPRPVDRRWRKEEGRVVFYASMEAQSAQRLVHSSRKISIS